MIDNESQGRFITGLAGPDNIPIDAMSVDARDFIDGKLQFPGGYPALEQGAHVFWRTPVDQHGEHIPVAGCRVVLTASQSADARVRCVSVDKDAIEAAGDVEALIAQVAPAGMPFKTPASADREIVFAVRSTGAFAIYLESGELISYEFHWLRAV